ncbi:MAG: YceI family protein [Hyphomonadaceae bacterium]|nr:YceI family protein [Hyphomonadaceae bacterium]
MNRLIAAAVLAMLAACAPASAPPADAPPAPVAPAAVTVPAGRYTLDKTHASLIFRVDHLGFSRYTGRFADFDATLDFTPADPARMALDVSIDPRSLAVENPPAGFLDELLGPQFLNAAQFPRMTFKSTAVELTGPTTARVTGDLTLHGVTAPVTLDVRYNGGYEGHPMDPNARIGFSATGALNRSVFGIAYGIPAPGTTMGVSDAVEIIVEAEFSGPPLAAAAAP